MIGEGELRQPALRILRTAGAANHAWLPGERTDIADVMRSLDLFVLPSLGEGSSNTILEAMACGRPVVATRVGGSPELVEEGQTGVLVPPADPTAMAGAIGAYFADPGQLARHGRAARKRVEQHFSMETMVNGYLAVYDAVMNHARQRAARGFVGSSA
jgi:glycosyltransferase involved in cell wall biosynthesis